MIDVLSQTARYSAVQTVAGWTKVVPGSYRVSPNGEDVRFISADDLDSIVEFPVKSIHGWKLTEAASVRISKEREA
jgi:hypothetical protein